MQRQPGTCTVAAASVAASFTLFFRSSNAGSVTGQNAAGDNRCRHPNAAYNSARLIAVATKHRQLQRPVHQQAAHQQRQQKRAHVLPIRQPQPSRPDRAAQTTAHPPAPAAPCTNRIFSGVASFRTHPASSASLAQPQRQLRRRQPLRHRPLPRIRRQTAASG